MYYDNSNKVITSFTGAGFFVLDSYYSSNEPVANNTAIVWKPFFSYYNLNLYCMSNSSSSYVSASIQYPYSSFQFSTTRCGTGCYQLYSTHSFHKGIYTCRIQDSRGVYLDLHFGMYPYGFNCKHYFMYLVNTSQCYNDTTDSLSSAAPVVTSLRRKASTKFTLICTSTTTPATTVVWTKDETTLSFDGTPYQHSQVVTYRQLSIYDNILTSTGTRASTLGSYTCTVSNRFGTNSRSAVILGNDVQYFLSKRVFHVPKYMHGNVITLTGILCL